MVSGHMRKGSASMVENGIIMAAAVCNTVVMRLM
jgi:hypothetical protein